MTMRQAALRIVASSLSILLVCSFAHAAETAPAASGEISAREQRVMATRTFLNAHPDLKYRAEGWEAHEDGDLALAMKHFMTAARYADKASQAMVAEMLWQGRGVAPDRPMAYAWADLAAERGYGPFVRLREQYWRQLDPAQRERALADGPALLPEYGDQAARPRMARYLKKARQRMRRSASYASQPKEVRVPDSFGNMISIPSHRFYETKFWDPREYEAWQDAVWKDLPQGKVDVGELEQVKPKR